MANGKLPLGKQYEVIGEMRTRNQRLLPAAEGAPPVLVYAWQLEGAVSVDDWIRLGKLRPFGEPEPAEKPAPKQLPPPATAAEKPKAAAPAATTEGDAH